MSLYDRQTMALATEIAQHAGSALPSDIDFVVDWLVNGGDDGSSPTELFMNFDSENSLPSKSGA